MSRYAVLIFFYIALAAAAQNQPFGIQIPSSIASEQIFMEYCLYGSGTYCSWLSPKPELFSYIIDTKYRGLPVNSLKAILYAPGCAIDTFSMKQGDPAHVFTCRALPRVTLTGELTVNSSLYGPQVELHASYVASWANHFFGTDQAVSSIPLVEAASLTEDNHFRFELPDFASDPVTALGFLHIWAKEKRTGNMVALLVPAGSKTKVNSLKVESRYPVDMVFIPCAANSTTVHDKIGFAIRGKDESCAK